MRERFLWAGFGFAVALAAVAIGGLAGHFRFDVFGSDRIGVMHQRLGSLENEIDRVNKRNLDLERIHRDDTESIEQFEKSNTDLEKRNNDLIESLNREKENHRRTIESIERASDSIGEIEIGHRDTETAVDGARGSAGRIEGIGADIIEIIGRIESGSNQD